MNTTIKYTIIPDVRTNSSSMGESNSTFLCPSNTVLTGRKHSGDENGQTIYEYATLKAIDESGNPISGTITVEDIVWGDWFPEQSGSGFTAPINRVLVGRQHVDDENGATKYAHAKVLFNGNETTVINKVTSSDIKESSGPWFNTDANRVMVGRIHNGDENGYTKYISGIVLYTQYVIFEYENTGYQRARGIRFYYLQDEVEVSFEDMSLLTSFVWNSATYPTIANNEIDRMPLVDYQARVTAFIALQESLKGIIITDNSRIVNITDCPIP